MRLMVWGILSLLLLACSSSGKEPAYRVTHTIVCKHWVNQCYFRAQEKCLGRQYDLLSTTETERTGGPHGRYREFTVRIGCI
jgi:hypothetical protein